MTKRATEGQRRFKVTVYELVVFERRGLRLNPDEAGWVPDTYWTFRTEGQARARLAELPDPDTNHLYCLDYFGPARAHRIEYRHGALRVKPPDIHDN